jgi:hypothetical protein
MSETNPTFPRATRALVGNDASLLSVILSSHKLKSILFGAGVGEVHVWLTFGAKDITGTRQEKQSACSSGTVLPFIRYLLHVGAVAGWSDNET